MLLLAFRVSQNRAALTALSFVLIYVVIAGAGFPVRRAGTMAALSFIAILCNREKNILNAFFFAFFLFHLLDPKAFMSLSFQLSFLSVFSMIVLLKGFTEGWRWSETLVRTLVVMAGTLPLILFHFNVLSFVNVIANLAAIPLFHGVLVSAFLSLLFEPLPLLGQSFVWMTHLILKSVLVWINFLANLKWGYLFVKTPSVILMVLYYVSLALFLILRKVRFVWSSFLRNLALTSLIIVSFLILIPESKNGFELTSLFLGKNQSHHLHINHKASWLFNTGRSARWTVEPYLKSRGVNHISGIFLTSDYKKYIGGLKSLLRNFSIDYVFADKSHQDSERLFWLKANKAFFKEKEVFQLNDESSVKSIGNVKNSSVYLITHKAWKFLLLPSLASDLSANLKEYSDEMLEVQMVSLPATNQFSEKAFEELMNYLDPHVMTIPIAPACLEEYLSDRDIHLIELKSNGATTFSVGDDQVLRVNSYLRGEVGVYSGS